MLVQSDPIDITSANEAYKEINSLVSMEVENLRKELDLPELYNFDFENVNK
ncbi:hypothetical protein [Metabacillus litoralis]|uniref:hypothetical protein n=1 Tax=Metabacillus litoralis TaxID=152268 RepID=UPI00203EA242|nr:hypothetical protein [Metabacillus litoralis]MCM3163730.1 hypothetical protein [Metabacillus litoralis]